MNATVISLDIDEVRRAFSSPPMGGEASWLTVLRAAFSQKKPEVVGRTQVAGPREFELWLASCVHALADARTASVDWMALIASQDSLWLQLNDSQNQLQLLTGEELPGRLFAQTQLDHQIQQTAAWISAREAHGVRVKSIMDKQQQDKPRKLSAHRALSFVQYNRDTAAAPAENFAKGVDERFRLFDPEGKVVPGAIAAAEYVAVSSMEDTYLRDSDDVLSTDDQVSILSRTTTVLSEAIENLGNERSSLEQRRALIEDRRNRLAERLNSKALDFERRQLGVVARYLSGTSALEYRVKQLTLSLRLVFGEMAPSSLLKQLAESATFDAADRGAQLESVEFHMKQLGEWFGQISALSQRTALAKAITFSREADNSYAAAVVFDPPAADAAGLVGRLRGIRIFAPFAPSPMPCRVSVTAPEVAKQKFARNIVNIQQPGLVLTQECSSLQQPASFDQVYWGAKTFWNACPYGNWTVKLEPLFSHTSPERLDVVLELLIDVVDGVVA